MKALELAFNFGLTYSTTFNMGGVAIVFGLFSMLILLETVQILSSAWIVLSVAYFLTVLTVVYFFLRAVRYSLMSVEAARCLDVLRLAEEIYEKGVGENTLLHRTMAGKFLPYGVFTKPYFIAGPAVLIAPWAVIALL